MVNKDGTIITLPENNDVRLNQLIIVGLTDKLEMGCFWMNPQLERAIRSRTTVPDLSRLKDAMTVAFKQSLDKHWPTVINIS